MTIVASRRTQVLVLAAAVLVAAALGYELGRRSVPRPTHRDAIPSGEPVARVQTVPIRTGTLEETMDLYGVAVPHSTSIHTYTLPFEVVVDRVLVTEGQHVDGETALLEVHRSPASTAAVEAARQALAEARQRLEQVGAKQRDGLATEDDLIQARGRVRRAETVLSTLREAGQDTQSRTVRALNPGVVSRVLVRAGSIGGAGAALVETADQKSIQIQLSAEAEDAPSIRPGMAVEVHPVEPIAVEPLRGEVTLVSKQVDPTTRLVQVLVDVEAGHPLLINQYVRGRVHLRSREGLIVPRAALVPTGSRYRIFTVAGGRAAAHIVAIGTETDTEVMIAAEGLAAGQPVVTTGAHQLEDGMRVTGTR